MLNLLYIYINTFRSGCAAPNMALFWSLLTSCFPVMLLTYFLNDSEILLLLLNLEKLRIIWQMNAFSTVPLVLPTTGIVPKKST